MMIYFGFGFWSQNKTVKLLIILMPKQKVGGALKLIEEKNPPPPLPPFLIKHYFGPFILDFEPSLFDIFA
jgi:hypothetical protein